MDQLAEEDTYGHLLLHMLMATHTSNIISVSAQTLAPAGHMPYQIMWIMTTSAIVMDSILRKMEKQEMLMMIYGMGKDVAQAAVAVKGTTHLTSANTSTTPHLRTWKLDSSHTIITSVSLIEIFVK